jgi:hypothetical protein
MLDKDGVTVTEGAETVEPVTDTEAAPLPLL